MFFNADAFSFSELRVTHHQNIVLPNVKKDDLFELWQRLAAHELATANIGLISDIIACPGMDYCSLATARSIPIAQAIAQRFASPERQRTIGELGIKISGCINACGHHHAGHIAGLAASGAAGAHHAAVSGASGADRGFACVCGAEIGGRGPR